MKDFYYKIKHIHREGHLPFVIRFAKVTIFHIAFETMISVYILELFVMLTKYFMINPTAISKILLLVFFPIIIVLSLSLVFGIGCTVYVANRVYDYSRKYNHIIDVETQYDELVRSCRNDVVKAHVIGMLLYFAASISIPILLIQLNPGKFTSPILFVVCVSAVGSILGIIWNTTGIFRNQRLAWHELLPELQRPEVLEKIEWKNYSLLLSNLVGNVVSLFTLFILFAIIIFNPHPDLMDDKVFKSLTTDYSFLVLSFVTLVVLYVKIGFSLLYSSKNKKEKNYPPLESVLSFAPLPKKRRNRKMPDTPMTGYPSIDKPWLKYYSEEAINAPLPECTMYEYVWQNNKDHLSDVTLRYYGSKITYGKLFDNIHAAARAFSAMGVRAGDIVTIMSMHTPETITAIYALNYLGAAANMVYMTLSEQEIVSTLQNTDSKMLLVLDAALERIEAVKSEINIPIVVLSVADSMSPLIKLGYALKSKPHKHSFLRYTDFLKHGETTNLPSMATVHTALAVIVYTSGTTGEPKGVMLSSDNLNALAHQYKYSGCSFSRGDTFFNTIPPFTGFGVGIGIHMPLCLGLADILGIVPDIHKITEQFKRYKPKHFVSGPPIIRNIVETLHINYGFLTTFGGGGESLTEDQERRINEKLSQNGFNGKYVTGYGMTEFGATVCTGMNHIWKIGTLGVPLPNVVVKIIAEDGAERIFNEVGEICFRAPNTMIGYFNNPEATNQVIRIDKAGNRWLHTGDLGYVDEDGFVHFSGRIKRTYITKNAGETIYKLFPQRIEELFEMQPFVRVCAVIAQADAERLNVSVAFVKMRPDSEMTKAQAVKELKELSQKELPKHHRPVAIHILDAMPMTASGKIDYRALEKQAEVLNHD